MPTTSQIERYIRDEIPNALVFSRERGKEIVLPVDMADGVLNLIRVAKASGGLQVSNLDLYHVANRIQGVRNKGITTPYIKWGHEILRTQDSNLDDSSLWIAALVMEYYGADIPGTEYARVSKQ